MHLNILWKRENQQEETKKCVVSLSVFCFFKPPHHFDLAVVMLPNVSVCIFFTYLRILSGREKKEALVGAEKPQSLMEATAQPFPISASWAGESNSR